MSRRDGPAGRRRARGLELRGQHRSTAVACESPGRISLSVAPVLLGGGVRLLDNVGPVDLQQVRTVESSGVTHLRYRVLR